MLATASYRNRQLNPLDSQTLEAAPTGLPARECRLAAAVLAYPLAGVVGAVLQFGTPFWIARMATDRLELLGWRTLGEGRLKDGRYYFLARSCGHVIIAFADRRKEAWPAAYKMAMTLTQGSAWKT